MDNIEFDWFGYVDNFDRTKDIPSICIIKNECQVLPEVTITIPTYRRGNTLKHALDSAIAQKCSIPFEIIVLDNNPERKDETEILMEKYKHTHLVSYYKNAKNLGMGGNWNRLFTLARSKWVIILHDDDLLLDTFIEEMMTVAQRYNADVVNSGFKYWHEGKEITPSLDSPKGNYKVFKCDLASNFCSHRAGMPTGILYKKNIYLKEGGVNQEFYPSLDYIFQAKICHKYNFLIYSKPLTIYRWSINESLNPNTIRQYLDQDYYFRLYMGELLKWPLWFVKFYARLISRNRINKLNSLSEKCSYQDTPIKRLTIIETLILKIIMKVDLIVFNWKNEI